MSYTKLFSSIVTSTIWTEPPEVCKVWITMLAIADKNGEVLATIPGLAQVCGVSIQDAQKAIDRFLSPDPYSRTPDDQGRRIEKIDGGWALLNYQKYREMASRDEQREAEAKRKARYRERIKRNSNECFDENVPEMSQNVPDMSRDVPETLHIAEAEADSKERKRMARPSLSQVAEYGMTLNPPFLKAESFVAFYESNGWKVGKNPMKDWRAAVRTWQQKEKAIMPKTDIIKNNGHKRPISLWD